MQLNLETKEDFIVIDYLYDLLGDISHCAFTFSGGNEEDIEYYREYLNKYGVKE